MLKIIDRYLIREFSRFLFIVIILFVGLFIVVDFLDFADNLISKKPEFIDIVKYYILFTPYIISLITAPALLMASLFSISSLSKRSEIIAMRSSGLSLFRIFIPIFILAFFFSVMMAAWNIFVVPSADYKKFIVKKQKIYKRELHRIDPKRKLSFKDEENRYYFINHYNPRQKIAHQVTINYFKNNRVIKRITADKAIIGKGFWTFYHGKEWTLNTQGEITGSGVLPNKPDSSFQLTPDYFIKPIKRLQHLTYKELKDYIRLLQYGGQDANKALTEFYFRFSFPFANFITVLFGAPLAVSHFRKKNNSISFSISLLICFFYYALIRVFQSLGGNGVIPPIYAAWACNLIFFSMGSLFVFFSNK